MLDEMLKAVEVEFRKLTQNQLIEGGNLTPEQLDDAAIANTA
jgi:hypothetical protein